MKNNTIDIDEIFYTLQGEGPTTGVPAIFLRVADCNLKCSWCDTDAKTDSKRYVSVNSTTMTYSQIVTKIKRLLKKYTTTVTYVSIKRYQNMSRLPATTSAPP